MPIDEIPTHHLLEIFVAKHIADANGPIGVLDDNRLVTFDCSTDAIHGGPFDAVLIADSLGHHFGINCFLEHYEGSFHRNFCYFSA